MIINELELTPFAGISKKDAIKFNRGLNVLFGPNEAGKSSIIEALLSAFFLPVRPRKGSLDRLFPHPQGDTIRVNVSFIYHGKNYQLKRTWGKNPLIELTLPNGNLITDEDNVRNKLDEFLAYGFGTYKNILIARQADIAKTIEEIKTNVEATSTLGEALRKTIIESDGVSIEKLRDRIENEIKELCSRWDIERDRPERDRGTDNPWIQGVGKVLQAYYKVDKLRRELNTAKLAEEEYQRKVKELKEVEAEKNNLSYDVDRLKPLSEGIQKRRELEPKLELLEKEEKELKEINKEWPIVEKEVDKLEKLIREGKEAKERLETELKVATESKKSTEIRKQYERVEPIHVNIVHLMEQIKGIPEIAKEDLIEFKNLEDKIAQNKTVLSAGKLSGKFLSKNSKRISLQIDLDSPESIDVEPNKELSFDADGKLIIESGQGWRLEVQSGEHDIVAIKRDYDDALRKLENKKSLLSVTSLVEVEYRVDERKELERKLGEENEKLKLLLDGRSFDDLQKAFDSLGDEKINREPDDIKKDLEDLNIKQIRSEMEINGLKNKFAKWKEKYEEHDKVFEKLGEISMQKNQIVAQLKILGSLPEGYESADTFQKILMEKEQRAVKLGEKITELKVELTKVENDLPENTTEEIEAILKESEKEFEIVKKRAQAVFKLKQVLEDVIKETDSQNFQPFVSAFVKYLAPLTANRYKSSYMNGPIPSGIIREDGKEIPIDLLSMGTRDGIAIALRLSLAEYLLEGRQGFIIMDDPLVNLDPERKSAAAGVLNEFAKRFQLIIATCDPNTAELLGGHQLTISNH